MMNQIMRKCFDRKSYFVGKDTLYILDWVLKNKISNNSYRLVKSLIKKIENVVNKMDLNKQKHNQIDISKSVTAIEDYKKNRSPGMISRFFGEAKLGERRADIYLRILQNDSPLKFRELVKEVALLALLATENGTELKKHVALSMDTTVEEAKTILLEDITKKAKVEGLEMDEVMKVVKGLIKYTNSNTPPNNNKILEKLYPILKNKPVLPLNNTKKQYIPLKAMF